MKKILKSLCFFVGVLGLLNCGGGPSVSVLPSKDSYLQKGQEITAKMDILWVIDNSGSMADEQTALAENFKSFIKSFVSKDYDYRMAVITTDAYNGNAAFKNNSGYSLITNGNPDIDYDINDGYTSYNSIESIFERNISQGTGGSGLEKGLDSILASLAPNGPNANFDFPREDAHLAIIVISDEEDSDGSPADGIPSANATPISDVLTFLDSVTNPSYGGYSIHSIITPETGPCPNEKFYVYHGKRYAEVSQKTDGIVASLCDDFAQSLEDLAKKIIITTVEFKLKDTPENPNALVVSLKSKGSSSWVTLEQNPDNGWTYDAERNSIVFHGEGIPSQGSSINILYDPDSL